MFQRKTMHSSARIQADAIWSTNFAVDFQDSKCTQFLVLTFIGTQTVPETLKSPICTYEILIILYYICEQSPDLLLALMIMVQPK